MRWRRRRRGRPQWCRRPTVGDGGGCDGAADSWQDGWRDASSSSAFRTRPRRMATSDDTDAQGVSFDAVAAVAAAADGVGCRSARTVGELWACSRRTSEALVMVVVVVVVAVEMKSGTAS